MQSFSEIRIPGGKKVPSFQTTTHRSLNTLTSRTISSINCKDPSVTCHGGDNFKFKYVSKPELDAVIKHVRRQKEKKQFEEDWKNFLRSKVEGNLKVKTTPHPTSHGDICDSYVKSSNSCTECGLLTSVTNIPVSGECEEGATLRKNENEVPDAESMLTLATTDGINNNVIVGHTYQLGPVLTKRLQDLLSTVSRMSSLLLTPGVPSQYEDEDVDRTIKRSLEFDAMFARNHLYEIQRLLKDTKQLTNIKPINTAELESKISAALKSVTQALQVYTRHVNKGSRIKYQQVVPIFQSISKIHSLLETLTGRRLFPLRQELEVSCSYVKQVLLEMSVIDTQSVSTVSHKAPRARPRHKPSADLSMYNRRQREWRKKSATLARAKFGPPSAKHHRQSGVVKENVDKRNNNCIPEGELTDSQLNIKVGNEDQFKTKDQANAKEMPFRNATRAVSEEQVKTMMEMIPHEKSHTDIVAGREEETRPSSSQSNTRDPSNVQLLCLTEGTTKSTPLRNQDGNAIDLEGVTTLTIGEAERIDALEYHQKVLEFQKSNSYYKDDKAVQLVDKLAGQILKEMLLDFQQKEVDQVIRTLYNLEFE